MVCSGKKTFGPFTAAQLQARSYSTSTTLAMADNGNAECALSFSLA